MTLLKVMCMIYLIIFSKGEQCKDIQHCSDCDSRTGRCLTDCDTGYFDQMCTSVCSKTCRNRSCRLSASGTGACTKGCLAGYQGPGCNMPCDSPGGSCTACPGGCNGGYCQLGSSCVSGCVDSYYGTGCKSCSSRCKSCNRITGSCRECHPGYFGPNCRYSCDHCLGSCEHGCTEGCLPGLYGAFCDKTCSDKCGPDPNISTDKPQVRDCHRNSGDCIYGCEEGWYGRWCSSPCSLNCTVQPCNSTDVCTDQDHSDIGNAVLIIGLPAGFSVLAASILLTLTLLCCKRKRTKREVQGVIPCQVQSDRASQYYCEIMDDQVERYHLPEMNQAKAVEGAVPAMAILADCFAAERDSQINYDVLSKVQDNSYTLMGPVVAERPGAYRNYFIAIEK